MTRLQRAFTTSRDNLFSFARFSGMSNNLDSLKITWKNNFRVKALRAGGLSKIDEVLNELLSEILTEIEYLVRREKPLIPERTAAAQHEKDEWREDLRRRLGLRGEPPGLRS